MVSRAPAENDWLARLFIPLFSAFLSLCMGGIVFYFSSERAVIAELQHDIAATSEAIHMLKQEVDMNRARRDEQMNALAAQIGHRR